MAAVASGAHAVRCGAYHAAGGRGVPPARLIGDQTGLDPSSGPSAGGTWVTISGSGFEETTGVDFGTTRAVIQVVSDPEVRALAPAHAPGAVDVRVTSSAGSSAPVSAERHTYR
ncbi:MAG TPA: IPT/TIG domain-containing protein [Acidimicrobiales bacterium]|nr:IPT/TIG domain-containing protein [Acidimicrobiales bacterium]